MRNKGCISGLKQLLDIRLCLVTFYFVEYNLLKKPVDVVGDEISQLMWFISSMAWEVKV